MKTYRDLIESISEFRGGKLTPEDKDLLAELIQENFLPDGVSLDDPIDPAVLSKVVQSIKNESFDFYEDVPLDIDVYEFFNQHKHLQEYVEYVIESRYDQILTEALAGVLCNWTDAFVEQAEKQLGLRKEQER